MTELRQKQTAEKKQTIKVSQKAAMTELRKKYTTEERITIKQKQKAARQEQMAEKRQTAKATQKVAMKILRKNRKTGVEKKEALLTDEIIDGSHQVADLKDTVDTIGKMDSVCQFCGALKFKKETGSTCCNNGKVSLDPLP